MPYRSRVLADYVMNIVYRMTLQFRIFPCFPGEFATLKECKNFVFGGGFILPHFASISSQTAPELSQTPIAHTNRLNVQNKKLTQKGNGSDIAA
eukprot:6459174-Amphidinium_carterae.2